MSRGRLARLCAVAAVTLLVAAVTAAAFLIRAGGTGPGNWPEQFELGSSDNGVLFQFAGDLFHGRALDWTFSPQVFVFPEIPISLVAYLIASGGVQLYYLVVAMINNALLFVAFFAVIRRIHTEDAFRSRLIRALLACLPLVLLPLVGTIGLFEFQLAPTYYFGMYLGVVALPLVAESGRRVAFILIALALALIVASNPLILIFTIPALACVAIVRWIRMGFGSITRYLIYAAVIVGVASAIRLVLFSRLQGTSPLSYIDAGQVPNRVESIVLAFRQVSSNGIDLTLLTLGAATALGLFAFAIIRVVGVLRGRGGTDSRSWTLLYYALVPITGMVAAVALLILNYLYLWPILVAPLCFALLGIRGYWLKRVGFIAIGLLLGSLVATLIVVAPFGPSRYFAYRDSETRCLDSELPAGMDLGYAGYFDARRLELTSTRPLLLIQLDYGGAHPYYWLTNIAYARDSVGRFFFVDSASGQLTISTADITSRIGAPDQTRTCEDGSHILIYTNPAKLKKIAHRYRDS